MPSNKCNESSCNILASYNFIGETQYLYCSKHKKENMIDIKHRLCNELGCTKIPAFNFKGQKHAIYCLKHKKDNMINVKHKRCIQDGCNIIPTFNFINEKYGLYCIQHKKENMFDVIHHKCMHNKRPEVCRICNGSQICEHNKCKNNCKICGGSSLCKSSWCETAKNSKYEGYCLRCFVHLFPDKPNTRNFKTKEKATADYILEKHPEFTWIIDKQIQDGCSRKRPDLLLDLGYQLIIVEIDENQHDSYDCSCENKRLMLLSQDIGHRPIVFIRFNPDNYLNNNKKVTSCWSINNLGVSTIKKTKLKEWNERLEALHSQISYWVHPENKTEKMVEIVQLFYDCN
jgi:hypothetical protein